MNNGISFASQPGGRRKKVFINLLSLAAAVVCTQVQAANCFPQMPRNKTPNAMELKSLEAAKSRLANICSKTDTQCGFDVDTRINEIGVFIQFAGVSEAGECSYMPGNFSVYRYSLSGEYLGYLPGL